MDGESKLRTDLTSEPFLRGVRNSFWELDVSIGNKVYVWVFAPDHRSFLMELECSNYGDEPIRGSFVDSLSRECRLAAYPQGNAVFEQWIKFRSSPPFICWDQDRGAIDIGGHTDWRPRAAWKTDNQIVSYLEFIRGMLHLPANGFERRPNRLTVSKHLFDHTLLTLQSRSDNQRESAGVWLGRVEGELNWIADEVRFHHELCNDRSNSHYLELSEKAKFDLYSELASSGKELIALIHTHPEAWVGLSHIDQENQISSRIGFWSLVIPWYGRRPWDPDKIGFHVRGRIGWDRLSEDEISSRFQIK